MKKKIAIIMERADITLGGAERSVFELTTALNALGNEVHILAATGQTNTGNIHILCPGSPGGRVYYFNFAEVLKKHLSENKYDIIHSVLPFDFADIYQPRGGTYAESIVRNAASYRNKFVETYKRLTAFTNFRRTVLLQAERKLCQGTTGPAIIALSQYVKKQFERHYKTNEKRITVIHNGVKTNKRINADQADRFRSQILAELGIKEADNPVLFLFVANNFRLKGLSCLIEAMKTAANHKMKREAFLIIAGNGRINKYQRLAKELNPSRKIRKIIFLGSVNQIQNALSIIDVGVLPTFYDPSSRFILEVLAAGKPVITTEFNGATDLFINNRHGKVVDSPENIDELAEAINYFTNTMNIKQASQAIIEDNIKDKVSINRAAKQLTTVYESILQKKGQR
jgi:UDP-glucose:(heptosyl)LPS alpha-1,3-glucosyltransferase